MEDEVYLTAFGEIVHRCWNDLINHYPYIVLHAFIVMPNHVHDFPVSMERADFKSAPTETESPKRHSLSEVIRGFKTFSTRKINEMSATPGAPVWQRNYYEHIIRNQTSLNKISEYIRYNPNSWGTDEENPNRKQ